MKIKSNARSRILFALSLHRMVYDGILRRAAGRLWKVAASSVALAAVWAIIGCGWLSEAHAANGALQFGSGTHYVTFLQAPGLGVTTFTIEAWFYQETGGTTATTGAGGVDAIPLITKGRGESDGSEVDMNFFLGINPTGNKLTVDFEDTTSSNNNHPFAHTGTINLNTWYHAAVTYDGDKLRLYLNGNEEVSASTGGRIPRWDSIQHAALATALNSSGTSSGLFKGKLDEVRVWNYARSQSQISANMNTEIASASGLIARWGLNEGTGTAVGDSSGYRVNGNFTGTPTWTTGPSLSQTPNFPTTVFPANGATTITNSPILTNNVSDPEASSMTVTFYGRKAPDDFVVIAMPDTQRYADNTRSLQDRFPAQTDWIVANKVASNIVYVAQLGDCVEHGDSQISEWNTATDAMYRLENSSTTFLVNGIPYGIAVGNHDQTANGNPSGTTTYYNQFFGQSHFAGRPYYGGRYGTTDNDNHYDLFSASGMDFIVIYMEYDPAANSAVLSWANGLLQTYSTRRGIVVSHYILNSGNPATFGAQGRAIYEALKGNANLHLMLSGHVTPPEGQRIVGYNGVKVVGMMSDYQDDTNGGDGYLRVLLFSPSRNKIIVKTYSPYTATYRSGTGSSFEIDYDMSDGFTSLGSNTGVTSGANNYKAWPDLFSGTTYQWYVTANDGTLTTTSPIWTFTTKPYDITVLDTLGGSISEGRGIAGSQAVGIAQKSDGTYEAVKWPFGTSTPTSYGQMFAGYSSGAMGTDGSQAVGYAYTASGVTRAFIWDSSFSPQMRECFALGGTSYNAVNMSKNSHTCGYSQNSSGYYRATGWYYNSATPWDMATLAGSGSTYSSWAYGIGANYKAVGKSETSSGAFHGFRTATYGSVYGSTDLGTLGGADSAAYAIGGNPSDTTVGEAQIASGEWHAFLYDTSIHDLGLLGSDFTSQFSRARALTQGGGKNFIVGTAQSSAGVAHAVISDGTTMMDLNKMVAPGSGWVFQAAYGITGTVYAQGRIVGVGTISGQTRGFVLTP
jgi:probable HAF family extracellular repeat protein